MIQPFIAINEGHRSRSGTSFSKKKTREQQPRREEQGIILYLRWGLRGRRRALGGGHGEVDDGGVPRSEGGAAETSARGGGGRRVGGRTNPGRAPEDVGSVGGRRSGSGGGDRTSGGGAAKRGRPQRLPALAAAVGKLQTLAAIFSPRKKVSRGRDEGQVRAACVFSFFSFVSL